MASFAAMSEYVRKPSKTHGNPAETHSRDTGNPFGNPLFHPSSHRAVDHRKEEVRTVLVHCFYLRVSEMYICMYACLCVCLSICLSLSVCLSVPTYRKCRSEVFYFPGLGHWAVPENNSTANVVRAACHILYRRTRDKYSISESDT